MQKKRSESADWRNRGKAWRKNGNESWRNDMLPSLLQNRPWWVPEECCFLLAFIDALRNKRTHSEKLSPRTHGWQWEKSPSSLSWTGSMHVCTVSRLWTSGVGVWCFKYSGEGIHIGFSIAHACSGSWNRTTTFTSGGFFPLVSYCSACVSDITGKGGELFVILIGVCCHIQMWQLILPALLS